MNLKKTFFIFSILFCIFINLKTQRETFFYSFHEGKVFFLLEFKKRQIDNQLGYEYSWGPSIFQNKYSSETFNDNYFIFLKKVKYFELKNKTSYWVKIEEIEKFKNKNYWIKPINKQGFSSYKIDELPKIENKLNYRNFRQKKIYYKIINIFRNKKNFFLNNSFPKLKKQAQKELQKNNAATSIQQAFRNFLKKTKEKELEELRKLYLEISLEDIKKPKREQKEKMNEICLLHSKSLEKEGEEESTYFLPPELLEE